MVYFLIKTILTAIIIIIVSEIAKKSSLLAAIIISIPLTSLLAFIWVYWESKDTEKIIDLSYNTMIMTIPSITFLIILPIMLKFKFNFSISIIISILSTSIAYYMFIYFLKKYGITI